MKATDAQVCQILSLMNELQRNLQNVPVEMSKRQWVQQIEKCRMTLKKYGVSVEKIDNEWRSI